MIGFHFLMERLQGLAWNGSYYALHMLVVLVAIVKSL